MILQLIADRIDTPIGVMALMADSDGNLRAVGWADHEDGMMRFLERRCGKSGFRLEWGNNPYGFSHALERYFLGDLTALDALPIKSEGTPFQQAVWHALREIPCGITISYGELARRLGKPGSSRAVGMANGSNPIAVVVPCHRVIGSDGSLTGYGSGIERKRWLLDHERNGPR
jgi:methylated-DNA-[protein]-cysteine S-methyltransferase